MRDYRAVNRAAWDERVPAHAASPDYAVERFLADPDFLSDVVRFDLPLLGDVSGLRGSAAELRSHAWAAHRRAARPPAPCACSAQSVSPRRVQAPGQA